MRNECDFCCAYCDKKKFLITTGRRGTRFEPDIGRNRWLSLTHLGIQFGGVLSSQAANNFMGTGLVCPLPDTPPLPVPVPDPLPPPVAPPPPPPPAEDIFSRFAPLSVISLIISSFLPFPFYFSLVFYFGCLTDSPSPSLPRTEQRPGSATLHRGEKGGQAGGEQNLHHFFLSHSLARLLRFGFFFSFSYPPLSPNCTRFCTIA